MCTRVREAAAQRVAEMDMQLADIAQQQAQMLDEVRRRTVQAGARRLPHPAAPSLRHPAFRRFHAEVREPAEGLCEPRRPPAAVQAGRHGCSTNKSERSDATEPNRRSKDIMKVNCISCGHALDLRDAYDDYEGKVRCFICGAMLTLRTSEGQVKSVDLAATSPRPLLRPAPDFAGGGVLAAAPAVVSLNS